MDYDDDEDDYEWDYIEDAYDEADNLAEHACPSPPYLDPITNNISFEGEDPYDIWVDLEYLSDSYYDNPHGIGTKKRKSNLQNRRGRKKQRPYQLDVADVSEPAVIFRNTNDRGIPQEDKSVKAKKHKPVALLKDWKERFRHSTGLAVGKASKRRSQSPEMSSTPHADISGEGFDLSSIESVAGVLPEEAINTLKDIIKEKGLDPEAVQVVLQDLLEGREPDFGEADEEDEEMDEDGDENMAELQAPSLEPPPAITTQPLRAAHDNTLSHHNPNENLLTPLTTSESDRKSSKKRKPEPSSDELRPTDLSSPLQSHIEKRQKQGISDTAKSLSSVDLDGHSADLEVMKHSGSEEAHNAPINPKRSQELFDVDEETNNENQQTQNKPTKDRGAKGAQRKAATSKTSRPSASSAPIERPTGSQSPGIVNNKKGKRKAETVDVEGDDNLQGSAVNGVGLRRSVRAAKKPRSK